MQNATLFDAVELRPSVHVIPASLTRIQALGGTPAQKADFIRQVKVNVEGFNQARKFIDAMLARAKHTRKPGGLWILGSGGVGKSFILDDIYRRYPPEETQSSRYTPVLSLVHQRLMEEKCPNCHTYMDLDHASKEANESASISNCQACGQDLMSCPIREDGAKILESLLLAQRHLDQYLTSPQAFNAFKQLPLGLQGSGEDKNFTELSRILMVFRANSGMNMQYVYAGICGPKLFAKDTERICCFFAKHSLFSSTFWFTESVVYNVYNLKELKSAQKWLGKQKNPS